MEIFGILFRIVLRSTPPVFSFILFFPTSPKMSQFYYTSDRRVKCKGSQSASTSVREPISVDYQCATKSRSACITQFIIVRYVFLAEFNVKTDAGRMDGTRGPDLARGPDFADPWVMVTNVVRI